MAGFGSSLRKAQRPGWEGAYLDYETLKLFLSQIETVYEQHPSHGQDLFRYTVNVHDTVDVEETAFVPATRRFSEEDEEEEEDDSGLAGCWSTSSAKTPVVEAAGYKFDNRLNAFQQQDQLQQQDSYQSAFMKPPGTLSSTPQNLTPPTTYYRGHSESAVQSPAPSLRSHEDQMPLYLRQAHVQSRAICGRFMGLLRAETEKVLLFTESRLGELANTAGCLRFPDVTNYERNAIAVSSSSEEEEGESTMSRKGLFPWSDSSEEDESSSRPPSPQDVTQHVRNYPSPTRKLSHQESLDHAHQQLSHFTEMRENTPLFQRSDQVLAEDMLSAIEEADGYTAVAVELAHVLKYVCVNLLAMRKICRKHDRLLMNRMLGGYHEPETTTLGSVLGTARSRFRLQWLGESAKLCGVYDQKLQALLNSRTMHVITTCLTEALTEYELSRSRETAMTNLSAATPIKPYGSSALPPMYTNSALELQKPSYSEDASESPSTSSTMSLSRLQYAVTTIHALREAGREKNNVFFIFMGRSVLSFRGVAKLHEGLDGCAKETLDFLIELNPDTALLLDIDSMHQALGRQEVFKTKVEDIYRSVLSAASLKSTSSPKRDKLSLKTLPLTFDASPLDLSGKRHIFTSQVFPQDTLHLCGVTAFLISMNYFVVHAPALDFVLSTSTPITHLATIIGMPNFAAVIISVVHCAVISYQSASSTLIQDNVAILRFLSLLSASMAILGNLLQGIGVNIDSIDLVVLGRFLLGFSTLDIVIRQVLSLCKREHVTRQSAIIQVCTMSGILFGLAIGSISSQLLSSSHPSRDPLRAMSWLMTICWGAHLVRLYILFRPNQSAIEDDEMMASGPPLQFPEKVSSLSKLLPADDSDDEPPENHMDALSLYGSTAGDGLGHASPDLPSRTHKKSDSLESMGYSDEPNEGTKLFRTNEKHREKRPFHQAKVFLNRVKKLLKSKPAVLVSLSLTLFTATATESLFTSAPLIGLSYFVWNSSQSCSILVLLRFLSFPAIFGASYMSRRFSEREVAKSALSAVCIGLFVMINWVSIVSVARRIDSLLNDTSARHQHLYDWGLGVYQYTLGYTVAVIGLVSLRATAFAMLSKLSPPEVLQVGAITTLLTYCGRIGATIQVLTVGFSHKVINLDFVNSLMVPLFVAAVAATLLVNRHYFLLL